MSFSKSLYGYCINLTNSVDNSGFSLKIPVGGERCNIIGECFERGSTSEQKLVIDYRTLTGEFCTVNGELSYLRCLMNTLIIND